MLRRPGSAPTVGTASHELGTALRDMTTATGRWLALQPKAQEVPVYAERLRRASADTLDSAGTWAGATAAGARERSARAAGATRTTAVNLALVAALLWWVDRLLTSEH